MEYSFYEAMDREKVEHEIIKYLRYLASREFLIKNWEMRPGFSEISITIYSIQDNFVRNTIAYGHSLFVIRDRLEAMVYELKRTEEYNGMISQYVTHDIKITKETLDRYFTLNINKTAKERADNYIEKVIFNPPATIVFFKDGQKVVVKCQEDDDWDEEKALAMAIVKHDHGLPVFNKILEKAERRYPDSNISIDMPSLIDGLSDTMHRLAHILGGISSTERSCKNCRFNKLDWSAKYEKDMSFCTSDNAMINHCKSISEDYENFYCKDFEPIEDTMPTSVRENVQIENLDDGITYVYRDGWNELVKKEEKK